MELKLDINKITKIVMKKNDSAYIEYILNNGTVEDVEIVEREKTILEKINELKNNPDVKKVNSLIKLSDNAGVLTKMAEGKYNTIVDVIKDSIVNEPLNGTKNNTPINDVEYKLNSTICKSAEIMKMDKKMDEIAAEKREEIADKVFNTKEQNE